MLSIANLLSQSKGLLTFRTQESPQKYHKDIDIVTQCFKFLSTFITSSSCKLIFEYPSTNLTLYEDLCIGQ